MNDFFLLENAVPQNLEEYVGVLRGRLTALRKERNTAQDRDQALVISTQYATINTVLGELEMLLPHI